MPDEARRKWWLDRFELEDLTVAGLLLSWKPSGAEIIQVISGSPADEAGLRPGLTVWLLRSDEEEVATDWHEIIEKSIMSYGDQPATFLVRTNNHEEPVTLKLPRRPLFDLLEKAWQSGQTAWNCKGCRSCQEAHIGVLDCDGECLQLCVVV